MVKISKKLKNLHCNDSLSKDCHWLEWPSYKQGFNHHCIKIIMLFGRNTLPYCKCDSNSEWYAVFSIWKFGLIPSLLAMSIAQLNLVFICTSCLFQSRCSSIDSKIFNRLSWYKSFTIQFELEAVVYFQFSWSWDNKFCFLHIET